MQIMTVGQMEAQQEYLAELDRMANSKSARWRNNTLELLVYPFRFATMVWEELKDRRRARLAKKLSQQSPHKPLVLQNVTRSAQRRCRLLALPAEIRLMIWERVVGGKLIVLHRKGGKIRHRSLDRDTASVINATAQIVRQTRHGSTATSTTPKVKFLAILQTCQMVYLETIEILYQSNTFICLDHRVLSDLCRGPTASHMTLIRSLHIHFHVNQFSHPTTTTSERQMFPSLWDHPISEDMSNAFHEAFPNLQQLSIFLQGLELEMCADLMGQLQSVYQHPISVHAMALQPPPAYFGGDPPLAVPYPIARILVGSECFECLILQPPRDPSQYPPQIDGEVNSDTWRVGRLRLRLYDGSESDRLMTLDYAVFDPEDKSIEPPLLWDVTPPTTVHP